MKLIAAIFLLGAVLGVQGRSVNRIVNGTLARENEFPHQVSLKRTSGFHFCGGSIIGKKWIATAAHCLWGDSARDIQVGFGKNDLDAMTSDNTIGAREIWIHPRYPNGSPYQFDFGLVELVSEIDIDDETTKIITVGKGEPQVERCDLSGWGATNPTGGTPNELNKINLPYQSKRECAADWGKLTINQEVQICTKADTDEGSPCFGDSGGPLICEEDEEMRQFGLVSFGEGRCSAGSFDKPAVYSQISADVAVEWYDDYCDGCITAQREKAKAQKH